MMGTGAVLQVVQGTFNTQTNSTSTTWVASGLTASITPTSATSKILIFVTSDVQSAASQNFSGTIYRGSTDLSGNGAGGYGFGLVAGGANAINIPFAINYLDSPATTTSTTYSFYVRTTGGTIYWCIGPSLATITLMEIAG